MFMILIAGLVLANALFLFRRHRQREITAAEHAFIVRRVRSYCHA